MNTENPQPSSPAIPQSSGARGSAPVLVVTQDLVNQIIARAKASRWGLDDAICETSLSRYAETDENALAVLLVSGWESKYDLVSIFAAAISVVNEKAQNDQALRLADASQSATKKETP